MTRVGSAAEPPATVPAGVHTRGSGLVLTLLPLAAILIHLPFLTRYGWFRDELYYLASADHLAWGFVDHPPLAVAILAGWRSIFGDSLMAVRIPGVLAAALAVLLLGLLVRRMGGGRFAVALAGLCYLAAPAFLGIHHVYSMAAFEPVIWLGAGLLLLRALGDEAHPFSWIALGAVIGLALLNGVSGLWLAIGIALSLLLVAPRTLTRAGPWLGGVTALLVATPYLLWSAANGWPSLELIRRGGLGDPLSLTPAGFVTEQVLSMNPATLPVWLVGLGWLWSIGKARPYRALGVIWVVSLLVLLPLGAAHPGLLAAGTVFLFAAGAVAWERILADWSPRARQAALVAVALTGIVLGPLALPALPVSLYLRYAEVLGITTTETDPHADLPTRYAGMHGWETLVAEVVGVYASLSPAERDEVTILTDNYGEAAAIDRLGREHGLPYALSGHNSYWVWGPRGYTGEVTIGIGQHATFYERHWRSVELVGWIGCSSCPTDTPGRPIWVARGLRVPLDDIWDELRRLD